MPNNDIKINGKYHFISKNMKTIKTINANIEDT